MLTLKLGSYALVFLPVCPSLHEYAVRVEGTLGQTATIVAQPRAVFLPWPMEFILDYNFVAENRHNQIIIGS